MVLKEKELVYYMNFGVFFSGKNGSADKNAEMVATGGENEVNGLNH